MDAAMPETDQPRQEARSRPVQTMAQVYRDLVAGVPPWVAFNEFLHEWFDYSKDARVALITDPISDDGPPGALEHRGAERAPTVAGASVVHLLRWRWAVFCAGAVDYLCERYGVPRPAWVTARHYVLTEPWYGFDAPCAQTPEARAQLAYTTPEALRHRNLLTGDRVFANKYEWVEGYRRLRAHHGRAARRAAW